MFTLDDEFLANVGLANLPASERAGLLQHIYEELELRVGTRLSGGMTDAQLTEYESILDRDYPRIAEWLDTNVPDFLDDDLYHNMSAVSPSEADDAEVICEYAATKWLSLNRPDYRDVVQTVFDEITAEIRSNAQRILGG